MTADFWIIIPSRAPGRGKSRLAPLLDQDQRRAASRAWLRHVVALARQAAGAQRTVVVSRSGEVLGLARRMGVRPLRERGGAQGAGLNPAVHQATQFAQQRGARAIAVLHADLPELHVADIGCLLRSLVQPGIALAPDRDLQGTNALALRPAPRSNFDFKFRFGVSSFDRHRAEARRHRIRVRVIVRPGLARDVDTPAHYEALARV